MIDYEEHPKAKVLELKQYRGARKRIAHKIYTQIPDSPAAVQEVAEIMAKDPEFIAVLVGFVLTCRPGEFCDAGLHLHAHLTRICYQVADDYAKAGITNLTRQPINWANAIQKYM